MNPIEEFILAIIRPNERRLRRLWRDRVFWFLTWLSLSKKVGFLLVPIFPKRTSKVTEISQFVFLWDITCNLDDLTVGTSRMALTILNRFLYVFNSACLPS